MKGLLAYKRLCLLAKSDPNLSQAGQIQSQDRLGLGSNGK